MKKKQKRAKIVKGPWITIPQRDWSSWLSDWLVTNMVMEAYVKTKKLPKQIRVDEPCLEDLEDGGAILHYEVR